MKATRAQRSDVVCGVTSLGRDHVGPEGWRGVVRQHWQSESQVHGDRDVTFAEDRSYGPCDRIPPVLAACRHTARGLMRHAGEPKIAVAWCRLAAQPWSAFARVGIIPEKYLALIST
jgi:hypothetical protein